MLAGNWEPASERCFLGSNFMKSVLSHEGWEWKAEGHYWLPKWGYISEKAGDLLCLLVNTTVEGDKGQKGWKWKAATRPPMSAHS
eukprot:gene25394-11058_t